MPLTIVEASASSLDPFIDLLEEAGAWLWARGIRQWAPGVHRREWERLRILVERGCLVQAYREDGLVGGCLLSELGPAFWQDEGDALYLSALAVARSAAGRGVGARILEACAGVTSRRGRRVVRLDCWDGNDFLKCYYRRNGFEMLGAVREKDYDVRLFEKAV